MNEPRMTESQEWLWDQLQFVLLDAGVIDKAIQVIPWFSDWAGVVHGIKDGIHVSYRVWFDNEGDWNYERNDD